jgi:3-oxoadipate enol-lactonase/4-carboxymuconolactone decarboxylase
LSDNKNDPKGRGDGELRSRGTDPRADSSWARGLEVRKAVLGGAHVDRALAGANDFDRDFQEYITRAAWGEIWTRPGLPVPTRHLLTIVMLATLNRQEELAMHLEATKNTGLSVEEVKEALMHVAVYAGVPAAHAAIKTAKRVFAARGVSDPPLPELGHLPSSHDAERND